MAVSIRPLHPAIGGEVSGCDLTKPLTREEVAALEAGMDRHAVLVFHEQRISDEQQIAFSRNFGEIENSAGGNITKAHEKRLRPQMNDVSNLDQEHKPLARDDRRRYFNLGNRLWHSDSSYRAIPAKYSLLSARTVASWGGDTEFADMRAAYDALDERTKAEVEDLVCEHSLATSRGALGFTELTPEEMAMFKPVRQRLVRTHPVSGRKSLYLACPCGRDHRLAGAGGERFPARSRRSRDARRIRLRAQVVPVRPRHVGQPPDHAPRAPLRRARSARRAPHHGRRRRTDGGAGVEQNPDLTGTAPHPALSPDAGERVAEA